MQDIANIMRLCTAEVPGLDSVPADGLLTCQDFGTGRGITRRTFKVKDILEAKAPWLQVDGVFACV